jgi:hypothetical protein
MPEGDAPPPSPAPEPDQPAPATASHDLDACVIAVLEQPSAIASVLDVVRRALDDGVLDRPEYADVQAALLALTDSPNTRHR